MTLEQTTTSPADMSVEQRLALVRERAAARREIGNRPATTLRRGRARRPKIVDMSGMSAADVAALIGKIVNKNEA